MKYCLVLKKLNENTKFYTLILLAILFVLASNKEVHLIRKCTFPRHNFLATLASPSFPCSHLIPSIAIFSSPSCPPLPRHPPPPPPPRVNAINFALDTLNKERAHTTHIFIEIVALNELVIDKSAFYARLYLSVLVSAGVKHGNLPFWPSGVTSAPSTPVTQGRQITELTVFKRNIVQLGSKMYHISVNLAIGRREKNVWVQKASGAAKRL